MFHALMFTAALESSAEQPEIIPLSPYLRYQSVLTAWVNGVRGQFLFDTGEGITAISLQFADNIRCHPWGRITGFRMTGERVDNQHCDGITIGAASASLSIPSAIILDIMSLTGPDVPHVDGAIGLDAFAGRVITIVPRKCIIIETEQSLRRRSRFEQSLQIRLVRDAEGVALSVDTAVATSQGTAWMELDTGNGSSAVVANHIAPLLGIPINLETPDVYDIPLANGLVIEMPVRTRDLIMDGNIGSRFLNGWIMTLDLSGARAWIEPASEDIRACEVLA